MSKNSDFEPTPIFVHPKKRQELFDQGQKLFNDEEYFEAHEVWEKLWHLEQGNEKIFIQGLIQVAGHLLHLRKGNWSGAQSLGEASVKKLHQPIRHSILKELDLVPLFSAIEYNLTQLGHDFDPDIAAEAFLYPKLY